MWPRGDLESNGPNSGANQSSGDLSHTLHATQEVKQGTEQEAQWKGNHTLSVLIAEVI